MDTASSTSAYETPIPPKTTVVAEKTASLDVVMLQTELAGLRERMALLERQLADGKERETRLLDLLERQTRTAASPAADESQPPIDDAFRRVVLHAALAVLAVTGLIVWFALDHGAFLVTADDIAGLWRYSADGR